MKVSEMIMTMARDQGLGHFFGLSVQLMLVLRRRI
jgi:hypothetical protein